MPLKWLRAPFPCSSPILGHVSPFQHQRGICSLKSSRMAAGAALPSSGMISVPWILLPVSHCTPSGMIFFSHGLFPLSCCCLHSFFSMDFAQPGAGQGPFPPAWEAGTGVFPAGNGSMGWETPEILMGAGGREGLRSYPKVWGIQESQGSSKGHPGNPRNGVWGFFPTSGSLFSRARGAG